MDSAKLKESLQKLSFIKTYSSLIIPLLIVGIGIGIFVFTYTISQKLKGRVNKESIALGRSISIMINTVPPKDQWKEVQKFQEAFQRDAEQISLLPKESTQRELLSYKVFPQPQDDSWAIYEEFGNNYRKSIENMIVRINAQDCPTQAEIDRDVGRGSSEIRDVYFIDRAKSISVYTNPSSFSGYTFWENYDFPGKDKAVTDCWYWQIAHWITEDVFATVEAINYGSNSIFTSPVKRIMNVDFKSSAGFLTTITFRGSSKTSSSSMPKYVSSLTDAFVQPFTARVSNGELDVVHFNVSVIVSAKAVPRFMQELCGAKEHTFSGFSGTEEKKVFKHNQITILQAQVNAFDTAAPEHQNYRYGEDAVVRVDLICEYIFVKAGYDEIKPEVVKNKPASKTAK
ncbi:MAG: hypothetical protein ACYTEE_01800 [Planctomycetota bacterium]|jgi:hypothetical protein